MKLTIAIISMLVISSRAFATADFNPDLYKDPPPPPPKGTPVYDSTGKQVGFMGQDQNNINQGSNTGQQSQSGGAGANAAAGAALMAAGAMLMSQPPTVPPGAMLMAMVILAMMQSGEDSGAAGQSANTGAASIQGNPAVVPNPDMATGSSGIVDGKIAAGKAALEAQGYKMSKDGTLTTPSGQTLPPSTFNSPSSMAAAGIDKKTIDDAQKLIADSQSGYKTASVGVNSGGGGGQAVSEGEGTGEAHGTGGMATNPFNLNADAKAKLMAGKMVLFDGEPIGVRGGNLFEMVHTCYQNKRKGNHFIETDTDVSVRAPASLNKKK